MNNQKNQKMVILAYAFTRLAGIVGMPLLLAHFGVTKIDELGTSVIVADWAEYLEQDNITIKMLNNGVLNLRKCKYVPSYAEFLELCKPDYALAYSQFLPMLGYNSIKDKVSFNIYNQLCKLGFTSEDFQRDSSACYKGFIKAYNVVYHMDDSELLDIPQPTLKIENQDVTAEQISNLLPAIFKELSKYTTDELGHFTATHDPILAVHIKNIAKASAGKKFSEDQIAEHVIRFVLDTISFDSSERAKKRQELADEPEMLKEFKAKCKDQFGIWDYKYLFSIMSMHISNNTVSLICKPMFKYGIIKSSPRLMSAIEQLKALVIAKNYDFEFTGAL
jgi:hypothetical protein